MILIISRLSNRPTVWKVQWLNSYGHNFHAKCYLNLRVTSPLTVIIQCQSGIWWILFWYWWSFWGRALGTSCVLYYRFSSLRRALRQKLTIASRQFRPLASATKVRTAGGLGRSSAINRNQVRWSLLFDSTPLEIELLSVHWTRTLTSPTYMYWDAINQCF